MSKPIVAIVGRPNVGKSTLFNALAGETISIVKDTPGVTRDRIYADVTWLDKSFTMIDTGGIEPDSGDIILSQMREQAQIAIDTADVIVFITDVQQGLVDSDAKVADMLRRSQKPVILVVNKVDSVQKYMMDVYEFYNLGIGEPIPISAANRTGLGDMLDEIVKEFPEGLDTEEDDDIPKIAVVGKPNVGKSSLINRLLGEDRVIVSDIAGTTRDAVDAKVKWQGKEYIFIDTAGLRRKGKIKEEIERVEHVNVGASKPVQELLEQYGSTPLTSGSTLGELIRRPELNYEVLAPIDKNRPELRYDIREQVNINIKYDGYITRQLKQVEQFKKLESKKIPEDMDYDQVKSLRIEAVQKLKLYRPVSIGQASRIAGVSPADVSVLLVYLESHRA